MFFKLERDDIKNGYIKLQFSGYAKNVTLLVLDSIFIHKQKAVVISLNFIHLPDT